MAAPDAPPGRGALTLPGCTMFVASRNGSQRMIDRLGSRGGGAERARHDTVSAPAPRKNFTTFDCGGMTQFCGSCPVPAGLYYYRGHLHSVAGAGFPAPARPFSHPLAAGPGGLAREYRARKGGATRRSRAGRK